MTNYLTRKLILKRLQGKGKNKIEILLVKNLREKFYTMSDIITALMPAERQKQQLNIKTHTNISKTNT